MKALTVSRQEIADNFAIEWRNERLVLLGYTAGARIVFYPVSSDGIECGILYLFQHVESGEIFGEIVISAKSAAYSPSQEQVDRFYPTVRDFLINEGQSLPVHLYGWFRQDGVWEHPYEIPTDLILT